MLTRLTHAGVTFALTVAAYQAYVLMLVPFVEPAGAAGPVIQAISLEELRKPPAALERYRPLLAAYFPADHWCFQTPPKIVENGQAMVVFDDYTQSESGELRVPRVAMIFFPGTRDRSGEPPRDAIILEPAGGATLQMNQQVGKRFGSMGRMQYGQLLGAVTVRSDMKEPGPQDDLLIETKDLYMNEEFLRTAEPVTLRLGQHRGRGRELVIKFYKSDSTSSSGGNVFGKLDSLEVTHEVAALIQPGSVTMFGKQTAGGGVAPPEAPAGATKKLSDAPAQITCTGPFRIDFANHVATFNDAVRLTQLQSDGTLDELTAPRDLTLYFAEVRHWGGEGASTPTPIASSPKLEPATVEARGFPDALIDLQAPSQGAAARGERLRIELISRQVTLEGGDEVSLNYHGTEVHAPMVRYELPPKDSHGRLGLMAALGGGGWLRAAADPKRPSEQLFVRWTQSMQMVRRAGQPVLVLDGRPRVDMPGMGTLWADQLELYLRERAEGAAPSLPQASSVLPATISAERIVATGSVGIESAEVNCRVSELDLELHDPATAPAVASLPGAAPTAAAGAARTADPRALLDRSGGTGPRRTYFITGRTLEIDAVVQDRRPQVSSIRVDGGVTFEESTTGAAGEAPLRIRAEHLIVTDASSPQAKIEIRGADAAGGLPAGEAEIAARGAVLVAPTLAVNRGTSQAWINSPGKVHLLMKQDAAGKPLATPQPLEITWQESMALEGDRITFQGDVHVKHADGWLRTRRLTAVLTQAVRFDGAAGGAPPELAQLECHEGARGEAYGRDPAGNTTSHQVFRAESIVINQITGAISGQGPGHLDSIHLSKGDGAWMVLPDVTGAAAPTPPAVPEGPPTLRHLSLDFVRSIEGNIHTPEVRVSGDVRTVYGGVDTWEQRLEMTAGGSPGPDTYWISCDSLLVTDSVLARMQAAGPRRGFGLVELRAETNVVIEAEHPQRGAFTLRGSRATYDQAKAIFVLQGDARTPATVTYQKFPGGPFEEQPADKFMYLQQTGDLRVEGFKKFEMNFFE